MGEREDRRNYKEANESASLWVDGDNEGKKNVNT